MSEWVLAVYSHSQGHKRKYSREHMSAALPLEADIRQRGCAHYDSEIDKDPLAQCETGREPGSA